VKRQFSIRHLVAALAWLGLVLLQHASPVSAMSTTMEMAAEADSAVMQIPDGMPCCPDTQQKPECGKDCPFMAVCAGIVVPATGPTFSVPVALLAVLAPGSDDLLSGLAQGPPARPPKA
jgi:hypothetical protein